MKRRRFLQALGAAAGALALPVPAAPLYIPPERLAFGVPKTNLAIPKTIVYRGAPGGGIFASFRDQLLRGEVDLENGNIFVSLITANRPLEDGVELYDAGCSRRVVSAVDPADLRWEVPTRVRLNGAVLSSSDGRPIAVIPFDRNGIELARNDSITLSWGGKELFKL